MVSSHARLVVFSWAGWLVAAAAAASAAGQSQFEAIPTGGLLANASAFAHDFDGDGDMELVVSADVSIRVIDNPGTLREAVTVIPAPRGFVFAVPGDVDGDGDIDFYLVGQLGGVLGEQATYRNAGPAGFVVEPMPIDPIPWYGAGLVDIDGDGDLDVVKVGAWTVVLFVNDGAGVFTRGTGLLPAQLPPGANTQLLTADFNRDGAADIVLPGNAPPSVLLSQPGGGYALAPFAPGAQQAVRTGVIADFDGDGFEDILLWDPPAPRVLYLGDGAGGFRAGTQTAPAFAAQRLVAADLDLDGDIDVAGVGSGYDGVGVLLNDGRGNFVDATATRVPPPSALPTRYRLLVAGDFDGDRDVDLYAAVDHLMTALVQPQVLVNRHVHLAVDPVVAIGGALRIELASEPGYLTGADLALAFVGVEASPPTLSPFGPIHVLAQGALSLPYLTLAGPSGSGRVAYPVPNNPALIGNAFAIQALFVDPSGTRPARLSAFDRFAIR